MAMQARERSMKKPAAGMAGRKEKRGEERGTFRKKGRMLRSIPTTVMPIPILMD